MALSTNFSDIGALEPLDTLNASDDITGQILNANSSSLHSIIKANIRPSLSLTVIQVAVIKILNSINCL